MAFGKRIIGRGDALDFIAEKLDPHGDVLVEGLELVELGGQAVDELAQVLELLGRLGLDLDVGVDLAVLVVGGRDVGVEGGAAPATANRVDIS